MHARRAVRAGWCSIRGSTGSVLALLLIGLVMVASASIGISERELCEPFYYFERQLMFVALGLVAALVGVSVPTQVWEDRSIWLLAGAFVLLILVLTPGLGHEVNGSTRWIRLGVMNFQASELARVMLLTWIASFAVRRADELRRDFKGFMKPVGVLCAAMILLLAEPDFGAATVLMATGLAVLFLAGVRLRHLAVPLALGVGGMVLLAVSSDYRLRRIKAFLDPWADPYDSGFQLTQSLIAIGRGEWFGVGLGSSVQKLFYLPEAHTDFVFAVMAEEFGLAGVMLVIGLFVVLVGRALKVGRNAAAAGFEFQSYLASAIGIWLGLAGVRQHRRQHGPAADQGAHAAALQLWRQQHAGHARLARRAGTHPPRDCGVGPRRGAARGAAAMNRRVAFIMAGGTGGHVFPALATARVLRRRGFDIVWLGTQRGIEARLVPAEGIPVEWLSVGGVRGKGVATLLAAPFRLVARMLQALNALRRHRPAVVLGAGGFASGPGGIAAWLLRRPLVVHEQNAVAGLTNRVLARLADRVLEGFPGSFGPRIRAEHVGNPVRPEIAAVAAPEQRYAGREGRARLLVFGGSQGSARLNAVVPAAIAELPGTLRPDVLHQTGSAGLDGDDRGLPQPRARRRCARLHRRHGGCVWLGGPRGVPLGRADRRGAGRRRRAGDPRAVPGGRRRSPDAQRRVRGRRRARRC